MGFRFRKSFKVAPGVKFNLNKKSVGVTFGGKGAHYTVNSSGKKTTSVGIPGTGVYYTHSTGGSGASGGGASSGGNGGSGGSGGSVSGGGFSQAPAPRDPFYQRTWFIVLSLIVFAPLGIFLTWKFTSWNQIVKGLVSAISGLWFLMWFLIFATPTSPNENVNLPNTTVPYSESQLVEKAEKESATVPPTTAAATTTEATTRRETTTRRPETTTEKVTQKVTEKVTEKQTQKQPVAEQKYILNTNTKKYHKPSCRYVDKISPENYQEATSVPSGYDPCAVCHPDR